MMPQRKESRRVLWRLVTTQGVIRHTPEPRRFKITIRRNSLKQVKGHSSVWFKLVFLKITIFNGR